MVFPMDNKLLSNIPLNIPPHSRLILKDNPISPQTQSLCTHLLHIPPFHLLALLFLLTIPPYHIANSFKTFITRSKTFQTRFRICKVFIMIKLTLFNLLDPNFRLNLPSVLTILVAPLVPNIPTFNTNFIKANYSNNKITIISTYSR